MLIKYLNEIFTYGRYFQRIGGVFDQCNKLSIKEGTREKRKKGNPIRRVIENPNVLYHMIGKDFTLIQGTKQIFLSSYFICLY